MTSKITIASAGNTEAPALAVLRELGYKVSGRHVGSDLQLLCAEDERSTLLAEGALELLGLAAMLRHRGPSWEPTDAEVEELLALDGPNAGA